MRHSTASEECIGDLPVLRSSPFDWLSLTEDYYWEADSELRLTRLDGDAAWGRLISEALLGRHLATAAESGVECSEDLTSALREKHAFRQQRIRIRSDSGQSIVVELSGEPLAQEDGTFGGYRGLARDVTLIERHDKLIRLGQTITGILSGESDMHDAIVACIRAICVSEGWEVGHFWCLDTDRDAIRFEAGWSVDTTRIADVVAEAKTLEFSRSEGLVGTVWATGDSQWVPDVAADPRVLRAGIAERSGWRNAYLVPVHSHTRFVGVLDFKARLIAEPDQGLAEIIRFLAVQIGTYYEQNRTVEQLRDSEELYSSTVELAAVGIAHVGPGGRLLFVNNAFCKMLGYSQEELLALTVTQISHPDDVGITTQGRKKLHNGEIDSFKLEKRYVRKDGTTGWVHLTAAVKRDRSGQILYDIIVVEDVSARMEAQQKVEYLATHDELTGLQNRAMFMRLLQQAIASGSRHNRRCGVMFIDLDRFKIVNDSLGHQAGDELLRRIAQRITSAVRSVDVVARLGGDEFVVLLDELNRDSEATDIAKRVLAAMLEPSLVGGHEWRTTASIGIAVYPEDAADAETLMKHADIAMYRAKEDGKNTFQKYVEEDTVPMANQRFAIESRLRGALENDELAIQYQPKVDSETGEMEGCEALLRWWNHELGTISPSQFIPIAEETGLIIPIGRWVLRTACAQNVQWQRRGLPRLVMAVNLSPRQFRDPQLLDDIAQALEETRMPPELLELEITETMLMSNVEMSVKVVAAIKNLGVRLAIDDFGTGYSSLSQLKQFPIDTLKIDRSFIRDIPESEQDQAITEAIISMGRTLGVKVVAEGVETSEQRQFLDGRRCSHMQGYLFGKPCHPDALAEMLREPGRLGSAATSTDG